MLRLRCSDFLVDEIRDRMDCMYGGVHVASTVREAMEK